MEYFLSSVFIYFINGVRNKFQLGQLHGNLSINNFKALGPAQY